MTRKQLAPRRRLEAATLRDANSGERVPCLPHFDARPHFLTAFTTILCPPPYSVTALRPHVAPSPDFTFILTMRATRALGPGQPLCPRARPVGIGSERV